jgi:ribose/xylose/arabinose/galactoside ABC-type transport system permease subunit
LAFIISKENSVVLQDLELAKGVKTQLFIFSPFSLATIAVFVLVGAFLRYVRYGREIHAIGGGREEAVAAGVPLLRPIVIAFTLSATMASMAGALTSLKSGSAGPNGFENLLLPAVTAALIGGVSLFGGKGTAFGVAIGALTIRAVVSGLSLGGSPFYVLTLATGVLLVLVIAIELLIDRNEARDRFREWRRRRSQIATT